jgi:dTDP-4-dehydrorhamnose reductase
MKVLVTGVKGQLGFDVVNELNKRGHVAVGLDVTEMDITDAESVSKVIGEVAPQAVIHCAAWTAVDAAEEKENVSKVHKVNVVGTQNIANECKKLGCKLLYLSTDYVFDGKGNEPWKPDCKNFNPLNVYGQTKLEGEFAVANTIDNYFIIRIAWVFGKNGNNFIKTMLKVGKKYDSVRVVSDQIGTPTYTYDLARLLVDMVESDKYGYYHATNEGGYVSWYEFAKEIFKQAGYETNVISVTTAEYGLSKAARPFNSRLDKSKLKENGFKPLPTWKDALARYLKEINYGAD